MKLFRNHKPISDAVLIERIRYNLALYQKYRWLIIAFWLVMFAGLVGMAIMVQNLIVGFNAPGMGPGFVVGAVIGMTFGLTAYKVGHGLAAACTASNCRSDTLLVRYFDALRDIQCAKLTAAQTSASEFKDC